MNLKVEKLLTAVFAAALGASFIATNQNVKSSAEANSAMGGDNEHSTSWFYVELIREV